jgi:hypothetical protein
MLNNYKAMIPCRSHILTLLMALTKKIVEFKWTKELQQAFDSLKNSFTSEVVLAYLDFSVPFEIYTNASKTKFVLSLPKKTSHLHFIQGNLPILK